MLPATQQHMFVCDSRLLFQIQQLFNHNYTHSCIRICNTLADNPVTLGFNYPSLLLHIVSICPHLTPMGLRLNPELNGIGRVTIPLNASESYGFRINTGLFRLLLSTLSHSHYLQLHAYESNLNFDGTGGHLFTSGNPKV